MVRLKGLVALSVSIDLSIVRPIQDNIDYYFAHTGTPANIDARKMPLHMKAIVPITLASTTVIVTANGFPTLHFSWTRFTNASNLGLMPTAMASRRGRTILLKTKNPA